MFGTYIRKGEILFYPFFEYYHDHDFEYSPGELGFTGQDEFRGKFRASEGLIFVSYGFRLQLSHGRIVAINDCLAQNPVPYKTVQFRTRANHSAN